MNKRLIRCILIGILVVNTAFGQSKFSIRGVNDTISANVESRLEEYNKTHPLQNQKSSIIEKQVALAIAPYGYFSPNITLFRNNQNFPTTISIHKGSPTRITEMTIQLIGPGRNHPDLIQAGLKLPIQRGQIFDSETYEKAKQDLFDAAEQAGYLKSRFKKAQVLVSKQQQTAKITLIFNTNRRYYFGRVHFNRARVSQNLLTRYIPFQFGTPYRTSGIIDFNNHLSGSGYFKQVTVKPHINQQAYVPIDVHLSPVDKYNFTLGGGFGTDTGIRGRAGLNVIPVNKKGHIFHLVAQGSMRQNALQAQYVIPGLNPSTDQYDITANVGNQNYSSGYANSALLTAAARHHKDDFQRILSINALYEQYNYNNIALPRTKTNLFFPRASFNWRRVDNDLFPKNGYNAGFNALAAKQGLLSKHNLGQISGDAKVAVTSNFLRTRLFLHTIQGVTFTNNITQVPLSLAFLLGGADDMKAYSFNSIGPGKQIEYYGIELQKETKDNWYVIGFVDIGDVYNPIPKQMKYGAGLGLMWVSPVGPIKVGLAQAVNNRFERIRGQGPRLVISMGPDIT